ncbi:MAG: isocitrate lyase/PEP mutase family protein [Streptosporangiaceae bacterium]
MTGQQAFAALHRRGSPFLLPNAWDVGSALLLADAGFPAVGTTSLGVTAAAGEIDGAGTGRDVTMAMARAILPRLPLPVTVDIEGGYGDDPGAVADLAVELSELGAAGINLEDARGGGALRTAAAHAAIIRAVVAAAPGLFVNARTDVFWLRVGQPGGRLDAATARLLAYQDAGASGAFVPAVTELADIAALTRRIQLPLNVLWQPDTTVAQLGGVGVARVSTGSALYRRALAAAVAAAVAAQHDRPPRGPDLRYDSVLYALRRPAARVS